MRLPLFRTSSAKLAHDSFLSDRGLFLFPKIEGERNLDGVHSLDPKTLRFTEDLAKDLNIQLPTDVDEEGIGGPTAIPSDFNRIHTVAGTFMDAGYPLADNNHIRDDYGLARDFVTPRHKLIWEELFKCQFGTFVPANFRIARDSSSCHPFFMKKLEVKKQIYHYIANNMDRILNYIQQDDLIGLYKEFDFVICYHIGYRAQPDKVVYENGRFSSKDRWINDFKYAQTAGADGQRFVADKTVYNTHGHLIRNHFKMRRRVVYGISGCVNYWLGALFSGFREHYLKEYAFTWKHTTAEEIKKKVERFKHFVGFDVVQYDSTFADWMFDQWCSWAREVMDERVVKLVRMAISAPYYMGSARTGVNEPHWLGNPFDPDSFSLNMGLPSGIPPNPDFGKYNMTATLLCLLDNHFKDVIEFGVHRVLRGDHPLYAILNMGDDTVLLSNDGKFVANTLTALEAGEQISPYFALEKEKSVAFLGNVFHRDYHDDLQLVPNVVSMINNWFAPEACTTSKKRRYWPIGWTERQKFFMHAPSYSYVKEILDKHFFNYFKVNPDLYAKVAMRDLELPKLPLTSDIDRIILEDPTKLYYRFEEMDVSPELLDTLVGTIPSDTVYNNAKPYVYV
jgi:hypothetical protein